MSLSGDSDWKQRRDAARAARHDREERSASKRPWQFPLIVGIAVALVAIAVGWNILFVWN